MASTPITDSERGWLAGILDGEGCFSAFAGGPAGNAVCVNVSVYSSDWRLIDRLKAVYLKLLGRIVPAYIDRNNGGWTINVSKKKDICVLTTAVLNHLAQKKAQAAFLHLICSRIWQRNQEGKTPPWVHKVKDKLQWFNKHKAQPDGTFVLSNYEKTRQSRAKPATPQEGVTSRHANVLTDEGVL